MRTYEGIPIRVLPPDDPCEVQTLGFTDKGKWTRRVDLADFCYDTFIQRWQDPQWCRNAKRKRGA